MTHSVNYVEKAIAIRSMLNHIKQLRQEQDALFRRLEVYTLFYEQGIDPEKVKVFGYDQRLDKRRDWYIKRSSEPVYNYVVMKTGERVNLVKAVPVFPENKETRKEPPAKEVVTADDIPDLDEIDREIREEEEAAKEDSDE